MEMLKQIQSNVGFSRRDLSGNNEDDAVTMKAYSPEEEDLNTYCCLIIDMPLFPFPVLHHEASYPSVPPHLPDVALAMLSVKGGAMTELQTEAGEPFYEFNLQGIQFSGQALGHIMDWDIESDSNPCEEMYRRIAHDFFRGRGGVDPQLKPNLKEKEGIDKILNTPGDHMKAEDKDLLFRFR